MEHLLQNTYEILQEIGSGGAGIVYLARHNRLDKLVVLKADRRKMNTSAAVLRREVESLKNLNQQYIPTVYDFFIEEGTVFTVIDYIQGDSFDKLLKKGITFTQAEVITWAKQLLEALVYLHARPPHGILHADIKPANIMLTPQNDIRLIDFNIALVLEEDGAVAVGHSFGYASPEHYRQSMENTNYQDKKKNQIPQSTENAGTSLDEDGGTLLGGGGTTILEPYPQPLAGTDAPSRKSTASGPKTWLDVRSDVYSLGATLYHLLSGQRPDREASEVSPLKGKGLSKPVIAIIKKAMHPNPKKRYQTAKEMLTAFETLHKKDPRAKRLRAVVGFNVLFSTTAFLLGGYLHNMGLTRMEAIQANKVLAEYSANVLAEGNTSLAIEYAMQSLPTPDERYVPEYIAEGQKALTDALGVYEFHEGYHLSRNVILPSECLGVRVSPDGSLGFGLSLGSLTLFSMETGEILETLSMVESALSEAVFVDDDHLFYASDKGVTLYQISSKETLWIGALGTRISVSANGDYFATIYKDESRAFVYNRQGELQDEQHFEGYGQWVAENDRFANSNTNLFSINDTGTLLGISFAGGGLMVYNVTVGSDTDEGDLVFFTESDYTDYSGGFFGEHFAFAGTSGTESMFTIFNLSTLEQTGGFTLSNKITVKPTKSNLYISTENILVSIHPVTGEQTEVAHTGDSNIAFYDVSSDGSVLTITEDSSYAFFDSGTNLIEKRSEGDSGFMYGAMTASAALVGSLDSSLLKILTLENYPEQHFASYDSSYEHIETRVSQDEERIILYSFEGLQIYDTQGNLQNELEFPTPESMFDLQFYRNESTGDYLEVLYYDGRVVQYSAKTGEIISETQGAVQSYELENQFETELYKIVAPLHGNPQVYWKETDTLFITIDVPDYLTYVTQIGEEILLEFCSSSSERYGLLCNAQLEILGKIPNLHDYKDGYFYFDEGKGSIKREKMYTLTELLELGRNH